MTYTHTHTHIAQITHTHINIYINAYYVHACYKCTLLLSTIQTLLPKPYNIVLQAVGQCHQMEREATFNSYPTHAVRYEYGIPAYLFPIQHYPLSSSNSMYLHRYTT